MILPRQVTCIVPDQPSSPAQNKHQCQYQEDLYGSQGPQDVQIPWGAAGPQCHLSWLKEQCRAPAFSTPQTNKIASSFLRPQGALQPGLPFKVNTDAKPVSKS